MGPGWSKTLAALSLLAGAAGALGGGANAAAAEISIRVGRRIGATAPTFLAHGWEPWTATTAFPLFSDPALLRTLSHLRGQTVRFGGISADFLAYTVDAEVTPPCRFNRPEGRPFSPGGQCPFSTGALDVVLDLCAGAGVGVMFDLNELIGRNCSQPKPPKNEWCGDTPAPWNVAPIIALLQHIEGRSRSGKAAPIALELGNELFAPAHLPRQQAIDDLSTLASLLQEVWGGSDPPPPFFGTGTNDCKRVPNTATIDALASLRNKTGLRTGFSFHSYPGNADTSWNRSVLSSFLLNTTWLRENVMAPATPCLGSLRGPNATASGAMSLPFAVTEAQSMCGGQFEPGAPTTSSFINGFFSIANLGMMAQAGAALVARWGMPQLLNLQPPTPFDPGTVASDFFLYLLYNATVGHSVLNVSGDAASDALVYAHCAKPERFGANGSVTLLAANPSSNAVTLSLNLPALPRLEYVLTAPPAASDPEGGEGGLASHHPVLNGEAGQPLRLGADGSLPALEPRFCSHVGSRQCGAALHSVCGGGSGAACDSCAGREQHRLRLAGCSSSDIRTWCTSQEGSCGQAITLPPQSQGFFVLLAANGPHCAGEA